MAYTTGIMAAITGIITILIFQDTGIIPIPTHTTVTVVNPIHGRMPPVHPGQITAEEVPMLPPYAPEAGHQTAGMRQAQPVVPLRDGNPLQHQGQGAEPLQTQAL